MLTQSEISRYNRHILLSEIGLEGQEKLKNSRVLVIGAGGLGCPVLLYLAAAGVGKIGIVDDDVIDETNLQRQILFDVTDIGKSKAETSKTKLQKQNPLIVIDSFNTKLTVENALRIFSEYDIVVDGTDNFATRYLVNDACCLSNKILVSGSLFRFQGQLSVFNFPVGEGPTYRCLFPSPPSQEQSPNCSATGVIGTLPGIIGTMIANEAIKIITGTGEILAGKLLVADMLTMNFQIIEFEKNPESVKAIPINKDEFRKMNYDFFCNGNSEKNSIKEISANELLDLITANEKIQILDVREPDEQPIIPKFNDLKIPLGNLEEAISQISRTKKVVVVCKSGMRSRRAIEILQNKYSYKNLFNLTGGVMEWMQCVNQIHKVMSEKKKHKVFVAGAISPQFIADSIAKHSTKTNIGAHDIFLGQVRNDLMEGKIVRAIDYSAYEEMAEEKFNEIRETAFAKFNLTCMHIYHSMGIVKAGEISLFVFVSSKHRADAFDACRWLVEEIKANVPIWGKEIFEDETYLWKVNSK